MLVSPPARVSSRTWLPSLAFLLLAPSLASAADLGELVTRYRSACRKVTSQRTGRAAAAEEHVAPILREIGRLESRESRKFLSDELSRAPTPEIAAVCVAPLLAGAEETLVRRLLGEFPRHSAPVQAAILETLGSGERSIAPFEDEILVVARGRLAAPVRQALPAVLGKIDSVAAARMLLGQIRAERGGLPSGAEERKFLDASVRALASSRLESVKAYLESKAFSTSDPARLVVLCRAVGELELEGARSRLEKLVGSRSPDVAAAAVEALSRIGVGDSASTIARALQRGGGQGRTGFRIDALDALAASGDEKDLEVVIGFATGRNPEARLIALGSLALATSRPGVLRVLTDALDDDAPDVRSVALRSLSRARDKRVIRPLIERLGEEGDYSFRVKVLQLLISLTGQNMGLVEADWMKWWEVAEPRFEFPEPGKEGFTSVKAYGLDYFGIEISSKRLAFLVDISSSMTQMVKVRRRRTGDDDAPRGRTVARDDAGDEGDAGARARKIDVLKKELARVIGKLAPDTKINIICFDGAYRAWQKQLQPIAGRGRAKAVQYVRALQTGRGTNVFDTVEFALADRRVDTLYLLTDGVPTRGRITQPAAILDEVARQNRLRAVTIHCIAFGEESDLLKDLAAQNGGQYRFVDEY